MKLDIRKLETLIEGYKDEYVILGPKIGEDSTLFNFGGKYFAIHSDPITGTADLVAWYSLAVSTNDIASTGIRPKWVIPVILATSEKEAVEIIEDLKRYSKRLGVCIVGGHTEVTYGIRRPIVSCTAMGIGDRYVTTGGAKVGDVVIMVREAGIEGTSIIAREMGERLISLGLSSDTIYRAKNFVWEISVVEQAMAIRDIANSMHDCTEGGVIGALLEVSMASEKRIRVGEIPVRRETAEICSALKVDPRKLISSGTLIATLPEERAEEAIAMLERTGVEAYVIGKVEEGEGVYLEKEGKIVREYEGEELDRLLGKYLEGSFSGRCPL